MTDEGAKALAAAIEKLAAVLGGLSAGIHLYHHGVNPQTTAWPFSYPHSLPLPLPFTTCNTHGANGGSSQ